MDNHKAQRVAFFIFLTRQANTIVEVHFTCVPTFLTSVLLVVYAQFRYVLQLKHLQL